jgi:hypothetical protein
MKLNALVAEHDPENFSNDTLDLKCEISEFDGQFVGDSWIVTLFHFPVQI